MAFIKLPVVKLRFETTPHEVLINTNLIALIEDHGDHCAIFMGGPPVKVAATFAGLLNTMKALGE